MRIEKPNISKVKELTEVARETFIQSHGHSSPEADFKSYMDLHFTEENFKKEIENPDNIYHLLYRDDELVGYSKIIYNQSIEPVEQKDITKLERIYLLNKVHGSGLGKAFFEFNVNLAKEAKQAGIWLFVWVDNHRAIGFYNKMGFEIVGSYDFQISKDHSNPNHQLFLKFN